MDNMTMTPLKRMHARIGSFAVVAIGLRVQAAILNGIQRGAHDVTAPRHIVASSPMCIASRTGRNVIDALESSARVTANERVTNKRVRHTAEIRDADGRDDRCLLVFV